jgi:Cu/Ag efflux protein CusF
MPVSVLLLVSCATAKSDLKGSIAGDSSITINATVTAVDPATRVVTLRGPDGREFDVVAGEDVRNLPQVAAGDLLTVTYMEAVVISLYRKGAVPVRNTDTLTMKRADPGQKPAAVMDRVITFTAVIQAIDPKVPNITFKGAGGRMMTVVLKDPKHLQDVNVGDEVVITYTVALAMAISKPSGKQDH